MPDEFTNRYAQLLLESTSEGVYGIDVKGRCPFANRATSQMTGWSVEEMIGREMHGSSTTTAATGRLLRRKSARFTPLSARQGLPGER